MSYQLEYLKEKAVYIIFTFFLILLFLTIQSMGSDCSHYQVVTTECGDSIRTLNIINLIASVILTLSIWYPLSIIVGDKK